MDDPAVHSGIVGAACDVIKYALELEKSEGNGKEFNLYYGLSCPTEAYN